jgi:beta-glucosidase-like glycosyl hydrolase
VVRGEWDWDGFIISDETAVANIYSDHHYAGSREGAAVDALEGGCDLELDNQANNAVFPLLVDAVKSGRVNRSDVVQAATRVLTTRFLVGDLDPPELNPYTSLGQADIYAPSSLSLAADAARQAIVLLKNDGGLPWSASKLADKRVCVFGPLANLSLAHMGNYAPTVPEVRI